MEKYIGNYLRQTNKDFPTACETLDYLAKNQAMAEMLGAVAGDKVILSGCVYDETLMTRTEGYVFVKSQDYPLGEVLHFAGDNGGNTNVHVSSEDVSVVANGYNYTKAYTKRTLVPGYGEEADTFLWADFDTLKNTSELYRSLTALQTAFDELTGEPLGIVKMWAGKFTEDVFPANYHLCDGSSLSKTDYPELFKVIGNTFGGTGDVFRLPNLKGMFVVGYNADDPDYNAVGKAGGEKTHKLTAEESALPTHNHEIVDAYFTHGGATIKNGEGYQLGSETRHSTDVGKALADAAHENRPPFFTLAYIIKIK